MKRSAVNLSAIVFLTSISAVYNYFRDPIMGNESVVALDDYRIAQHRSIAGIGEDLSGITYSKKTKTLFAVVDEPTSIIELSLEGDVLRIIPLNGFEDTEGITHIDNNRFAILQERAHSVGFIEIYPTSQSIEASNAVGFTLPVEENSTPKKGPEGVAWSNTQGLFVANEQLPSRITALPKPILDAPIPLKNKIVNNSTRQIEDLPLKDISGLHVNQPAQRLLVLSDESRRILELDFDGNIQSMFKLTTGFFDQEYIMEQPEGITMDDAGNIYIVGEPNIFLVLEKPKLYAAASL